MSLLSLYGCSLHSSGEKYRGVPTPLRAQCSPVAVKGVGRIEIQNEE